MFQETEDRQPEDGMEEGLFGFVPHRLELKNLPQYDNFPYNLVFMGFANIDGVDMTGTACYYPDFSTFTEEDGKQRLLYFNQHSRDWKVAIVYDKEKGSWEGEKYHLDEYKGGGGGTEWRMAFAHITMSGLAKGEKVKFEKM